MGKAKDGSECFTRQGKGGVYITCKGSQSTKSKSAPTAKSKIDKEIEQLSKISDDLEAKKPKKKYNKGKLEDRIDIKIRQLDGRSWKSGRGRAKNPHKGMKKNKDGTATTGALREIVENFESGKLKETDTNRIMYEASKTVLKDRKK
tara:strand:+ start:93 stop:533 length:441 start_codon:yes stop_codon:yes gene_type:complete